MSIFITVFIKTKEGCSDGLKVFLLELAHESRGEKACMQYDLYQCSDNKNIFIIYEEWVEYFWFAIHAQQDHVNAFKEASAPLIEEKFVHKTDMLL